MKNTIQKFAKHLAFLSIAILVGITSVYATGTLTPTGEPGDATHYSLKDIENKLTDFTATPTATTSPFTVPGEVEATFPTLTEIYDLLAAEDTNIIPEKILTGTTIFGVTGTVEEAPELQWSAQQDGITWAAATLHCSLLTDESVAAGIWRMPTRHELEDAINAAWADGDGEAEFAYDTNYWSGTELSATNAWYAVWFGGSLDTDIDDKTGTASVRCVR